MRVGRYGRRERARRVSWAVKATSTLCVRVVADPNSAFSTVRFFVSLSLSGWINVFEASHQSFTFRLNPLSRHVSGREAFPSDSTEPIPSSPFFSPTRGHVSKSRIGFSPFRKRTPLHCTSLVTIQKTSSSDTFEVNRSFSAHYFSPDLGTPE